MNDSDLIEPYAVQDKFCTRLARVERLGPCRWLVFYSATIGAAGASERHVVAKLVMTAYVMEQIAALLFTDESDETLDRPRLAAPH